MHLARVSLDVGYDLLGRSASRLGSGTARLGLAAAQLSSARLGFPLFGNVEIAFHN